MISKMENPTACDGRVSEKVLASASNYSQLTKSPSEIQAFRLAQMFALSATIAIVIAELAYPEAAR